MIECCKESFIAICAMMVRIISYGSYCAILNLDALGLILEGVKLVLAFIAGMIGGIICVIYWAKCPTLPI